MGYYNKEQEMFVLATSSNQCGPEKKDPESLSKDMLKAIKLNISKIPEWEVVWGPAVFQHKENHVYDNAMYAAYNQTTNSYFVSIAGTNKDSNYDWKIEDLNAHKMESWPNGPKDRKLSKGTSIGHNKLAEMKPVSIMPGAGMTLVEFLLNDIDHRNNGVSIIVGGHSLGGAQSPVMALLLTEKLQTKGNLGDISCQLSAGPTPGNDKFAEYYNEMVPKSYRIHNVLDVVPHAFNENDLKKIKTIYDKPSEGKLKTPYFIINEINNVVSRTKGNNYTQVGIDKPLLGEFNFDESCNKFVVQMGYQHVKEYFNLLKLHWPSLDPDKSKHNPLNPNPYPVPFE